MEPLFFAPVAFSLFMLFMFAVMIGSIVLWVWTIVDIVKVPSDDRYRAGNQLTWILVVVLTGVIGSIIYLVVGRPPAGWRR